jgi:non-specific serine/threonine protein kinase
MQVATDLLREYADGVWFIDLAPLSNATLLVDALLRTLALEQTSDRSVVDVLVEFLRFGSSSWY